MTSQKTYLAIGLMSGTSIDAVDVALIETDGYDYVKPLAFSCMPYEDYQREQIRACFGRRDRQGHDVLAVEKMLSLKHAEAVNDLLQKMGRSPDDIDVIGFHGQTIFHAPDEHITIQIGDGTLLAQETAIEVVNNLRAADVKQGGQGAPLAPVYHKARIHSTDLFTPVAILNIGGVANITWIGSGEEDIVAFDTGPGNALMDDWARLCTGQRFDEDGRLAASGIIQQSLLDQWLAYPYFTKKPPKSLDRNEWDIAEFGPGTQYLSELSPQDGAATLQAFTIESILASLAHLPEPPKAWYVCGGGRHNLEMTKRLGYRIKEETNAGLYTVDELGWNGDATEAECFAYLAVRSLLKLPISYPMTTGCPNPISGGVLHKVFASSKKQA